MKGLNPKIEADRAEEQQEQEFLNGGEPPQNVGETHHHQLEGESTMKARVLVLFVCISLAAVAAMAHGAEEHVIGTVSKVTADSITVKTTANKTVTVGVVPATIFMMGKMMR
jgi:hypothetical protein